MPKKLTVQDFITKAKKVHGDRYDYSKVEYVNNSTKVLIFDTFLNETFWMAPNNHLRGQGTPSERYQKIREKNATTKEGFIEKAIAKYGDKYDYSKVEYVNNRTKICIICPQHGEFWQTPDDHLTCKYGCNQCARDFKTNVQRHSIESFIEKSRLIHGDKYDYSKVEYVNNRTKVCIICPIHGEFWQEPSSHLLGMGCMRCGKDKLSSLFSHTTEYFISKAKEIHGDKYDYSKVEYINNHTKVCIICPIHGEFWQEPASHLHGCQCPQCHTFKMENDIIEKLNDNKIDYIHQYRPPFLRKGKSRLSLDIYLPKYKIAIECQGKQHFEPIGFFGGEATFRSQIRRDKLKKVLCEKEGIKLLYFTNLDQFQQQGLYHDINDILNIIRENEIIDSVIVDETQK